MSFSLFNRHANMSGETLSEIGSIINEAQFGTEGDNGEGSWELVNQLYGLYDGYLYDDLLINADNLPKDLYRRIIKVWVEVSKYPVLSRCGVEVNVLEGVTNDIEWSEGMGVAEGKAYLASLES